MNVFQFFADIVMHTVLAFGMKEEVVHIQMGNPGDTEWKPVLYPAIYLGQVLGAHYWLVKKDVYHIAESGGTPNGNPKRYCTNSRSYDGWEGTLKGYAVGKMFEELLKDAEEIPIPENFRC